MLDLLNRFKKNNDPLDNIKAAQLWWKKIQTGDMASVHAEVAELVNRFIATDEKPTVSRLQALLWLDDQIQPAQESLVLQYVQNPRMSKTIESRLWHQVMGLAHHMIVAYLRFIRDPGKAEEGRNAPAKPDATPSIEPFLSKTMARTLRYLGMQAKFQYFRFLAPDKKFWAMVNQIYRFAEVKGVDSDSFPLYESVKQRSSSCADEYLQIMMLSNLNSGALTPRQMELASIWMGMWSHHIVIEKTAKPGEHLFYVDLSGYEPVRRVGNKIPQGNIGRSWSTAELAQQIGLIRRSLESGSKSSSLDESFRQPGALDLIRHIEAWWLPEKLVQPQRHADRVKVKKMLEGEGLFCEFIAPRLWEDKRTIDGGYTSNSASDRKYAIERSKRAIDIANAIGCKDMVLWLAREGSYIRESKCAITQSCCLNQPLLSRTKGRSFS